MNLSQIKMIKGLVGRRSMFSWPNKSAMRRDATRSKLQCEQRCWTITFVFCVGAMV